MYGLIKTNKDNFDNSDLIFIYGINYETTDTINKLSSNYKQLEKVSKQLKAEPESILSSDICLYILKYFTFADAVSNIIKSNRDRIKIDNEFIGIIESKCCETLKLFHEIQSIQNKNLNKKYNRLFKLKIKEKAIIRKKFIAADDWEDVIKLNESYKSKLKA